MRRQDVEAAEAVEAAVDANALAVFLAQKTPEEVPGAEKRKKEFDEQARGRVSAVMLVAPSTSALRAASPDADCILTKCLRGTKADSAALMRFQSPHLLLI